jgi:hypothetical protein
MIEVDLAEAKAQKTRLYIFLILGAVALAFLLMLLAETLGKNNDSFEERKQSGKVTQESTASQDASRPIPTTTPSLDRSKLENKGSVYPNQAEFKELFFKALKNYKETVEPRVSLYETLKADRELKAAMASGEQEAASLASRERYKDATEALAKLANSIEQRTSQEELKLDNILTSIRQFWKSKKIDPLAASINAARAISPEHPEIHRFTALSRDWPKVERLLRESSNHDSKGDLGRALRSLQEVKSLSHDIENLDSRIRALQADRVNANESKLVESLFKSLNSSDLEKSAILIEDLQRQGISESTYSHLLKEYQKKKYDYDLRTAKSDLERATSQEMWNEAKRIVDGQSGKFDEDSHYRSQALLVQRIHAQLQEVDRVLLRPEELTSASVRTRAHFLREKIAPNIKLSRQLQVKAEQVDALLIKYRTKVSVTILSDALTHVEVKSVGKVGEVLEKTIKLLPGKYTLTGKKPGHVSKQVELEVLPLTPVQIKVIADEPI